MTLDTMLARILDEVPGADLANFIHEANAVQAEICDENNSRWSWLLTSDDILTADSATSYDLPADFSALEAVVNDDTGVPLTERTVDHVINRRGRQGWEGGRFSVLGDTLELMDVPSDGTTLKVWYWKTVADITSIKDAPNIPASLHGLVYDCLLYWYMERAWGDKPEMQRRIYAQQAKYQKGLQGAIVADRQRSKPYLRLERVLF